MSMFLSCNVSSCFFNAQQAFPGMICFNGRFESSRRIPNTCNFSILGQEYKGSEFCSPFLRIQTFILLGVDDEIMPHHWSFRLSNFLVWGKSFKAFTWVLHEFTGMDCLLSCLILLVCCTSWLGCLWFYLPYDQLLIRPKKTITSSCLQVIRFWPPSNLLKPVLERLAIQTDQTGA